MPTRIGPLLGELSANAKDRYPMVSGDKPGRLAILSDQLVERIVAELEDRSALVADHVAMWWMTERVLIANSAMLIAHLANKPGLDEQAERPVDRASAHMASCLV